MQTSYSISPSSARAGLLYDVGPYDSVTRTGAALLPFGAFVVKDTGDGNVKLPVAGPSSSSVVEGVVIYDADTQSGLTGDGVVPGVEAGKPVNILRKGRIWVYCETSFNPDSDSLYLRTAVNGALTALGNVRKDADTANASLLGASGFLVAYTVLNTLTAAGFLALDVTIPGAAVR